MGARHDYNCFGCSPFNEIGLQLEFWEDGDELIAKWQPRKSLEGWGNVLHGGIQAALLDELAGWIVLVKVKTSGVTSALNVKYLKPVNISKGEITVKGKIILNKDFGYGYTYEVIMEDAKVVSVKSGTSAL